MKLNNLRSNILETIDQEAKKTEELEYDIYKHY